MPRPRDSSLELFAHQAASLFVAGLAPRLTAERESETLLLYEGALRRAFGEVANHADRPAPWSPLRVATRAEAYTFGEFSNEVLHQLHTQPTAAVARLAQAIEQVVGPNVGVLRAYARDAPRPLPPPSATFVPEPLAAATPEPENTTMNPASPRADIAFTERISTEANEAAWLIFAGKSVEVAQQSVGAFLQRNLAEGDPALRAKIGVLMETKLGEVITALVLSAAAQTFGGTVAEKVGVSAARMDHLASKLRVHAMASGGKALIDDLLNPFLGQLTDLIRAMPDEAPALLADRRTVDERTTEPVRSAVS